MPLQHPLNAKQLNQFFEKPSINLIKKLLCVMCVMLGSATSSHSTATVTQHSFLPAALRQRSTDHSQGGCVHEI